MIRSLLMILTAYAVSLIQLFGQLFWFHKKKDDQFNHGNSIVPKEEREIIQIRLKRKGLLRQLKRIRIVLLAVSDYEKIVFRKLENKSGQRIIEKAILNLAYARKEESYRAKKFTKIERKFTRMFVRILLPNSPSPSSPECLCHRMPLEVSSFFN